MRRTISLLASFALIGSLAACGDSESTTTESTPTPGGTPSAEPSLDVAASFYPLEFAVQRIAGERVAVSSLTQPGADPHDAELTPREVARLGSADLVVFLSEFQPAVDDGVASAASDRSLDVTEHANLTLAAGEDGHGHGEEDDDADEHADDHDHDHADDHEGETEEEHAAHDHDHGGTDPHFWLDPTRYASVAEAIADRLIELDPDGRDDYQAGVDAFTAELTTLDDEFMTGLQSCTHRDLVTGHEAFGYLADRYDLDQQGIAGLSPESEPSAAQLRDLVEHVRESGVSTIYAETLVSPALAETIAREAGAEVKTLDPIEGLTDASAGNDYFEIMRVNLQTLREGQDCT